MKVVLRINLFATFFFDAHARDVAPFNQCKTFVPDKKAHSLIHDDAFVSLIRQCFQCPW